MPRRISPRAGWHYPSFRPGVPNDRISAAYPPALLAKIAAEFRIPAERHERFAGTVLHSAAIYVQSKQLAEDRPKPTEVRQQLKNLSKLADELHTNLEVMDDVAWQAMTRAEWHLIDEAIEGRSTAMQEIGAFRQVDAEHDAWEFYTRDDFAPVLRLIAVISRRAEADARAPKRGNRPLIALRRWSQTVFDFWEELGQPMTFDHNDPESSETYWYARRLLEPLDAGAVGGLVTVLRAERKRRRQR